MMKVRQRFLFFILVFAMVFAFAGKCSKPNPNKHPNVNGSNPPHMVCTCVGGLNPDNGWACNGPVDCEVHQ